MTQGGRGAAYATTAAHARTARHTYAVAPPSTGRATAYVQAPENPQGLGPSGSALLRRLLRGRLAGRLSLLTRLALPLPAATRATA
ncbi:hypothetical protein FNH04_36445, partial [Streptomyces phyllanthi]